MVVQPQPHEVKRLVVRNFLDLGATSCSLFGLYETLLAQDRQCVARTYRIEDYHAVWAIHDGTLKFYDASGCLLRVVNLRQQSLAQVIAA